MEFLRERLSQVDGGTILDFGTGRGQSVKLLMDCFRGYSSIVGVDIEDPITRVDQDLLTRPNVSWQKADGEHLPFPDGYFDTASIMNVLHHLKHTDIQGIISEVLRTLKPKGRMIVVETICDGLTEAQMTQVHFHHWRAEIDRLMGREHNPTFTRAELMSLVSSFNLNNLEIGEHTPVRDDCNDRAHLEELADYMSLQLEEVRGHSEYCRLRANYDELVERMYQTGFLGATSVVVVGYEKHFCGGCSGQ